jgi:hypothetical protein
MKMSHLAACSLALAVASGVSITTTAHGQTSGKEKPMEENIPGLHDFDPLVGKWRVHHRRLKERLAGSHEWVEFEGTCELWQAMGGYGNFDDNVIGLPGGAYRAMTVRAFDIKDHKWSIWWIDGRTPQAPVDPPVRGGFRDGVGTFYADDTFNGKPVRIRFEWSKITATSAHWEQAFSPDAGKTWETNWRMDLERMQ